ncbi:hypothetical protein J6590_001507 [Homalodisca vitripennis]|nr:hypothetical protein J6590_001507 [Homalodisca vitripennis]
MKYNFSRDILLHGSFTYSPSHHRMMLYMLGYLGYIHCRPSVHRIMRLNRRFSLRSLLEFSRGRSRSYGLEGQSLDQLYSLRYLITHWIPGAPSVMRSTWSPWSWAVQSLRGTLQSTAPVLVLEERRLQFRLWRRNSTPIHTSICPPVTMQI